MRQEYQRLLTLIFPPYSNISARRRAESRQCL